MADGVRCRAAAGTVQRRRRVWLLCASVVHGLAHVWCECDVCVCEALCGGEGAGECGCRVAGDLIVWWAVEVDLAWGGAAGHGWLPYELSL